MNQSVTIEGLVELVSSYDREAIEDVMKAYEYAYAIHGNQRRKSGELYIVHPVTVASILANMHADKEAICAALLHDVIEDGDDIHYEDIESEFGKNIAILVDGVTKMPRDMFQTKQAQNYANVRKILMGITVDPRIIIIKLADRLHNMRTLCYLSKKKQIENSIETLEIFVPLAEKLGFHQVKNELEDWSYQYLNYDVYQVFQEKRNQLVEHNLKLLEEMKVDISSSLQQAQIESDIHYRIKGVAALFQKLIGYSLSPDEIVHLQLEDVLALEQMEDKIHDFRSLHILVSNLEECYESWKILKHHFSVVDGKEKDCIQFPKTNGYQSLHTTIYGLDDELVQTRIQTFQMDQFASIGLASYWAHSDIDARVQMTEALKNNYPFYRAFIELDSLLSTDDIFVKKVKEEVLSKMIYPHMKDGKAVELPVGATLVDFIANLSEDIVYDEMVPVVNGKIVPLNYQLSSKDMVEFIPILRQSLAGCIPNYAKTTIAKNKILVRNKA